MENFERKYLTDYNNWCGISWLTADMLAAFQHFELTVRDLALFSRREGGRCGKLWNSNLFFISSELKLLSNSSAHNLVNNLSSHHDFSLSVCLKTLNAQETQFIDTQDPGVTPTSSVSITRCSFINNWSQLLHILITFSLFFVQPTQSSVYLPTILSAETP